MWLGDLNKSTMELDRKGEVIRRLYILGIINLVASVASIVIGGVAVSTSDSKFPYNAGGGIIGGTFAIFLTCCPCYIHHKYKEYYGKEFGCSLLCMVIWFSIAILALPIGLGISGVYGLVECGKTNGGEYCDSQTDTKTILCVFTILVSTVLIFVDLCIFFTCCCNSATLGLPLLAGTSSDFNYTSSHSYRVRQDLEAEREMRRNVRPMPPPTNRPDTVFTIDNEGVVQPTAPDRDGESNLGTDEPNVRYNTDSSRADNPPPNYDSTNSRLDDPPPSYEEVMRTT